jgi:two-component system, NarL family, nitrate/nitrite response regulator NarL
MPTSAGTSGSVALNGPHQGPEKRRHRARPGIGLVVVAATRLYGEGLASILGADERIEVLGTASTCAQGLALAAARQADVVLIDVSNGAGEVKRLVDGLDHAVVVAFGVSDEDDLVLRCAEAGVRGYVPREATVDHLRVVIEGVVRDELVCSSRLAGTLLRHVHWLANERHRVSVDGHGLLTRRESEIVDLIDEGLSNKEIATRLHISLPTVKNHVHHILEKLGVSRRAEAAARVRTLHSRGR